MRIHPATGEISTPTRKTVAQTCGTCRYYLAFAIDDDPEEEDDEDEDDEDDDPDDDDEDEDEDDDDDEEPDELPADDPEGISGFCRRYPPVPTSCRCGSSVFPEVAAASWCGEFLPAS